MVAKWVKKYLVENKLENVRDNKSNRKIYLTDTECNFIHVAESLLNDIKILKNIEKI